MTNPSISSEMLTLVNDPIKISMWFEIQRNPSICAKELIEKLNWKGTNIYYHLNQLEEKKLIISETKVVPHSNLLQKTYHVNELMYSKKETDERLRGGKSLDKAKEIVLLRLYYLIFLLNRQIIKIHSLTNENVKNLIIKKRLFLGAQQFFQEEDLNDVVEKYKEVMEYIDNLNRKRNKSALSHLETATHSTLLNLFPLDD